MTFKEAYKKENNRLRLSADTEAALKALAAEVPAEKVTPIRRRPSRRAVGLLCSAAVLALVFVSGGVALLPGGPMGKSTEAALPENDTEIALGCSCEDETEACYIEATVAFGSDFRDTADETSVVPKDLPDDGAAAAVPAGSPKPCIPLPRETYGSSYTLSDCDCYIDSNGAVLGRQLVFTDAEGQTAFTLWLAEGDTEFSGVRVFADTGEVSVVSGVSMRVYRWQDRWIALGDGFSALTEAAAVQEVSDWLSLLAALVQ